MLNRFRPILGNKVWNLAILGAVGVLIIALFVYGIGIEKDSSSKIKYSPEDIAYGVKLHAVHDMRSRTEFQHLNLISMDSSAKPKIRLSEKYYDFGFVNADLVLTRTFVIANFGQSSLVIQRAYTTCGCTIADFTASEIPPGKVALMTLRFDTGYHEMSGTTVRRGVMIETNDSENPTQEIWIQASVR